jgi:hypothetical protein
MNTYYETENGFAYGEEQEMPLGRVTVRKLGPNRVALDHTYVKPELRGQGIAKELVLLVARKAQKEGWTIVPTCSYARRVLEADASLRPLIAE